MKNVFNKIIKEKLEGENLSSIANKLGIPRTVLFEWTKTDRNPSFKNLDYILKLCDYLGLTLEEILTGVNSSTVITSLQFEDNGRKYQVNIKRLK
ncbi:MAG: helix-turn-helix transcriptional regulator [Bacteriovoracaceae bacterium]